MSAQNHGAGVRASLLDCINEQFVMGEIPPRLTRLLMAACTKRKNWNVMKPHVMTLLEQKTDPLKTCTFKWQPSLSEVHEFDVSILSLAVLSGNIEMFVDVFDLLFPLETKAIGDRRTPCLWDYLTRQKHVIRSRRIPDRLKARFVAQLTVLLKANKSMSGLLDQESLQAGSLDEYQGIITEMERIRIRFHTRPNMWPSISWEMVKEVRPDEMKPGRFLSLILKAVVLKACEPEATEECRRWMKSHGETVFRYLRHWIEPAMCALERQVPDRTKQKWHRMYGHHKARAIQVHPLTCLVATVGSHLHVRIPLEGKKFYHFITVKEDWKYLLQEKSLVFIRSDSGVKHPFLRGRTKNNRGRISSLTFGLEKSEGILFPGSLVKQCFVDYSDQIPHGTNLNDVVEVYRIHKKSRKPVCMDFWTRESAFLQSFSLSLFSIRTLAPLYRHLTLRQKEVLLFYFWHTPLSKSFVQNLRDQPELLWFVKPLLDYLVRHLPPNQLHKQFLKASFQFRLESLPLEMRDGDFSTLMRVSVENPVMIAQQHVDRPAYLRDVFATTVRLGIQVVPVLNGSPQHLWQLVHCFYIPAPLRRVFWQSLVLQQRHNHIYNGNIVNAEFKQEKAFPVPSIQLEVIPLEVPRFRLVYDRDTGLIESLRYDALPPPLDDIMSLTLEVKNEEGQGLSVMREVLTILWKKAVENNVMLFYEDDGLGPSSLIHMTSVAEQNFLYCLGFISAFTLLRGLFLPFPLSQDLWRYLCQEEESVATMEEIFTQRATDCRQLLASTPSDEVLLAYGEEQKDYQGMTPMEIKNSIIRQHMLPQEPLKFFRQGWRCFFRSNSLRRLIPSLNHLFCEPSVLELCYEHLVQVFDKKHDLDDLFLKYVEKLPKKKLTQLIAFITGKPRLPLVTLGEHPLTVAWADSEDALPKAQNCINTLIIPQGQTFLHSNTKTGLMLLDKIMSPIFEFDTVFGFI